MASLVSSTTAVQLPLISSLSTTTASTTLPVLSSSLQTPVSMTDPTPFLHPKDAVATSPNLKQYSAVRQLTNDLQLKKPRHPRRPRLPLDGIDPPVRRLVHTAVYKQKLAQYIDALKLYETHLDELIQQTTLELDNNNNKLPPSKLRKYKSTQSKTRHLSPLNVTVDNHPIPPKKKYKILEDPVFIDSGILPPTLHPLKTPSQSNTMTDEFPRTHLNFKANLPSLYMTPTSYKFGLPQDRNFDHYVAHASKNLPQLAFWQNNRIRFFQFQFNFLNPTHHDLNTNSNDKTTTPSVKKLHHQTYQLFLEQKHPQNFIFQNHKFTSPFSYHFHYSLNHPFTIRTIRNYDPVRQYFNLFSYHDPTRPLFVPQEALNVNDDFLLPTHIPNANPNFFPKMNKLVETPLDDHSRSLYTALIHKHFSLAQLNFIIAKLSSFFLKKTI